MNRTPDLQFACGITSPGMKPSPASDACPVVARFNTDVATLLRIWPSREDNVQPECECANLPSVFKVQPSLSYVPSLPAVARGWSVYRGPDAVPGAWPPFAAASWVNLVRCPSCGQHWQVDEVEYPHQLQLAARVDDAAAWNPSSRQDEALRKDFVIQSRGGLSTQRCAWVGCTQRALRDLAYCVDCGFQRGLRE